jgi:hypothetical protein
MSWMARVLSLLLVVLTGGGAWAIWHWKLKHARLYHGESGVVVDSSWEWIQARWYRPEAHVWLWVMRALVLLAPVAALIAVTTFAP